MCSGGDGGVKISIHGWPLETSEQIEQEEKEVNSNDGCPSSLDYDHP